MHIERYNMTRKTAAAAMLLAALVVGATAFPATAQQNPMTTESQELSHSECDGISHGDSREWMEGMDGPMMAAGHDHEQMHYMMAMMHGGAGSGGVMDGSPMMRGDNDPMMSGTSMGDSWNRMP